MLFRSEGNIEKAADWLREKGIAKAQKKVSRIAAEGLCNIVCKENKALIYEVNSETDFVAKNKEFIALVEEIGDILIDTDITSAEDALGFEYKGKTIETAIMEISAKIGEKITLRRLTKLNKTADEVFGVYKHMGGKSAVVAIWEGKD